MKTIDLNKKKRNNKKPIMSIKQFSELKHLNSSEIKYMSAWAQYDESQNLTVNLKSNRNY